MNYGKYMRVIARHPYPIVLAGFLTLWDFLTLVTLVQPLLTAIMLLTRQSWGPLMTPDTPLTGSFWTDFPYLAWRNRWNGLDYRFAKPLSRPWDQSQFGLQTEGSLWWARLGLWGGKRQLKIGWRMKIINGIPYGEPCLTITVP